MSYAPIAQAVARAISAPTLFGEAVSYRQASGATLTIDAVVDRKPPGIEFSGSTNFAILDGSVLVRREDLADVTTGRDEVTVTWFGGTVRTAVVREVLQVSAAFWRLGVVF